MNFTSKIMLGAMVMASSSFAIVGFGGHYAPTMGTGFNASQESILDTTGTKVNLNRGKLDNLSGFGVKLWIDALPFVDLEATGNFGFGSYSSDLTISAGNFSDTIPVQAKMDIMGKSSTAKPIAFIGSGDISVLYPFLKFPPVLNIVKVYAGAGVSYKFNSAILSKDFIKKAAATQLKSLTDAASTNGNANGNVSTAATDIATAVATGIAKEGLETGIGGHLVLGAKAKLPVIPIAAYANYKYYMGGVKSPMDAGSVFEIGGGIAF